MLNISRQNTFYQTSYDKHNDNVICYVFEEVVLCR